MIDTMTESLLSLTEAAKILPARRGGKRPHTSCLYRWAASGCKGVVLETIQCGGTKVTSREALARFFERLTAQAEGRPQPRRSEKQRRRDIERAERELDAHGY